MNFKQLLWRCGFMTNVAGQLYVDKKRASDYLCCSVRTLERWMEKDNPCPRAVKMLQSYSKTLPDEWEGFCFDRNDKLCWPERQEGLTPMDVKKISLFYARAMKKTTENEQLTALLNELRDPVSSTLAFQKLLSAINQLHELSRDPLFKVIANGRVQTRQIN